MRDQVNQLFANQTDIRLETGTKGGIRNVANVGVSASVEDYAITSASLIRNAAGQALVLPPIAITNPNTVYTGPINTTITAQSKSEPDAKPYIDAANMLLARLRSIATIQHPLWERRLPFVAELGGRKP